MAASTNQVVSVKVGAVLASTFTQTFTAGEKRVVALGKQVDKTSDRFDLFHRAVNRVGDALKRLNQVSQTTEQRAGAIAAALQAQTTATSAASRATTTLARGYERAARARADWNRAMATLPPALPASVLQTPPPFPRQSRSAGSPGSTGVTGPPPLPTRRRPNQLLPTPGQVLGQAAAGLGAGALVGGTFRTVSDSMKSNALFEADIQGVLNTADVDPSELNQTRKRLLAMSGINRTSQDSTSLLSGLNVYASAGGINFQDQLAATEIAGRVATASRSDVGDVSRTGVSLMQNLKVPVAELKDALGMMTVAGKEGSFELKDMSRHFPSLGAMAAQLGMTGKSGVASLAAAMQAVRKNTGTSGEAATNMENLFSKITSNETIQRLDESGIDWSSKVREVLASNGEMNMLEEFLKMMQDATGGDAIKLKKLVPDMQANAALTALLQHQGVYQSVKATTLKGSGADVDRDYAKNAATTAALMTSLSNSADRIGKAFGKAFESVLPILAPTLDKVAGLFETIVDAAPGAVIAVTGLTAAIGAAVSAVALFGTGGILAGVGPAFMTVFGTIGTALASVSLPVLAIGAAIAAAGLLVYKYWEPIKAWFIGFGSGVMEATAPIWQAFGDALVSLQPLWAAFTDVVGELLEPLGLTSGEFSNMANAGKSAGKIVGDAIRAWLTPLKWALEAMTKVSDWLAGSGDIRGQQKGRNSETITAYGSIRDKLIGSNVWSDEMGRDTVDIGKLTKMVIAGEVTAKEAQTLADAQNMEGVSRGTTLDDTYMGSIQQLAKIAARREGSSTGNTEQTNNVTITVDARGASPEAADKLRSTMQDVSKRLTGDLRDQTRGTHQDNTSPGVQ